MRRDSMATHLLLASLIVGALLHWRVGGVPHQTGQHYPIVNLQEEKTADLSLLINETLSINNKSTTSLASSSSGKDDWTFDMVEYDLMEFLQELSARYKSKNITEPSIKLDDAGFEAKSSANKTEPTGQDTGPTNEPANAASSAPPKQQHPTQIPQLQTSLASGDHEIGESSWQYGIFDRFTRPKSSTKPPTTPSHSDPQSSSSESVSTRLDVRQFNSDECGLRTYDDSGFYYPMNADSLTDEIKPSIPHQRLTLSALDRKKFQMPGTLAEIGPDQTNKVSSSDFNFDATGYDSNNLKKQDEALSSSQEGEYNLASRRQWLQQQLGSTLLALGFNLTNSTAGDFYQGQISNLGATIRENMMKKANKLGKSLDGPKDLEQDGQLAARQDDLKLEARVIGGSDARLGDSPWSVSLQALVSRPGTGAIEYRHYCGGTIIGEYYVLTAAHCLDFMVGRESRLFVVVGDLNWRMSTTSQYGRRFGIEKLMIHGGYKSTAFGHDIGLIKTKESMKPLKVNGRYIVNSVCLPQRNVEHSGEAELVGWGLFSNRNEMADSLQIADVPILPRPLCVDLYKRRTGLIQWLIGIELITDKQVCAGTFGRGICQGDSGSALVVNEKFTTRNGREAELDPKRMRMSMSERETRQSRATIIGVVAFGGIRRCSYQSLPGVYMQTSKYLDWILPKIEP